MHGDLYAHNILWNPASGQAVLSDFGAATALPMGQPAQSGTLQALKVRAFGVLLDELVSHAQPLVGDAVALKKLSALAGECLVATPAARPDMREVAQQLAEG